MALDWREGSPGRGVVIERLANGDAVHEVHNWVAATDGPGPFIADLASKLGISVEGSDEAGYLVFNIAEDGEVTSGFTVPACRPGGRRPSTARSSRLPILDFGSLTRSGSSKADVPGSSTPA